MKIPEIENNVGHADAECKKKSKHKTWLKWGIIATCFFVLIIIGAMILPSLFGETVAPEETNSRYKDYVMTSADIGHVWPWEYLTVYEKYTGLNLDGIGYYRRRAVSEELVGELIGTYTVSGYDIIEDEQYSKDFEVYQLKYADKQQLVAVKMEGSFYVFNREYNPPSTLGELFELVDFSKVIELSHFHENGNYPDQKHFALNKDDYVWEVLADCKNATFVEDDKWLESDREYISFTVTSETLGVYKVAMYVTTDGYLWTNVFDYAYIFNIGEDAAGKIIKYAKENSTEVEYEPYQNTTVGKIVEITDEYILVDDSILCNNPADGIVYKVMMNSLRISRYVDRQIVKEGDTVRITYEGEIDETNGNIINNAVFASKAEIYDEDVLNPE